MTAPDLRIIKASSCHRIQFQEARNINSPRPTPSKKGSALAYIVSTRMRCGQCPEEWGPSQYKYYVSVMQNDTAVLASDVDFLNDDETFTRRSQTVWVNECAGKSQPPLGQ